jgi:hypothetical protein
MRQLNEAQVNLDIKELHAALREIQQYLMGR